MGRGKRLRWHPRAQADFYGMADVGQGDEGTAAAPTPAAPAQAPSLAAAGPAGGGGGLMQAVEVLNPPSPVAYVDPDGSIIYVGPPPVAHSSTSANTGFDQYFWPVVALLGLLGIAASVGWAFSKRRAARRYIDLKVRRGPALFSLLCGPQNCIWRFCGTPVYLQGTPRACHMGQTSPCSSKWHFFLVEMPSDYIPVSSQAVCLCCWEKTTALSKPPALHAAGHRDGDAAAGHAWAPQHCLICLSCCGHQFQEMQSCHEIFCVYVLMLNSCAPCSVHTLSQVCLET